MATVLKCFDLSSAAAALLGLLLKAKMDVHMLKLKIKSPVINLHKQWKLTLEYAG